MSLKIKNNENLNQRIVNLDFLRGLVIFGALYQHFVYYLNVWYTNFFSDQSALNSNYANHLLNIDKNMLADHWSIFIGQLIAPWVSQIYLAMAAFNLALRDQESFKDVFSSKVKIFGLIYLYFVVENFIVAPNTGIAISFYPIMLWMVVLTILSVLYRYWGIKGVLGLTAFTCLRFILPINELSDLFEGLVQEVFHPSFEYDARIEYFMLSGCLGFIMGYVHFHKENFKKYKDYAFGAFGFLLFGIYLAFGDAYYIPVEDILKTEHLIPSTLTGTFYVLGIQAIVLSFFLWLANKKIDLNFKPLVWMGSHSLLIFALHRILFIRFLVPLTLLIGNLFAWTYEISLPLIYFYIFLTVGLCYLVSKTPMIEIVFQRRKNR